MSAGDLQTWHINGHASPCEHSEGAWALGSDKSPLQSDRIANPRHDKGDQTRAKAITTKPGGRVVKQTDGQRGLEKGGQPQNAQSEQAKDCPGITGKWQGFDWLAYPRKQLRGNGLSKMFGCPQGEPRGHSQTPVMDTSKPTEARKQPKRYKIQV